MSIYPQSFVGIVGPDRGSRHPFPQGGRVRILRPVQGTRLGPGQLFHPGTGQLSAVRRQRCTGSVRLATMSTFKMWARRLQVSGIPVRCYRPANT